MNAARLGDLLGRLARAAPGAFLNDPVFRTAAISALLALLFLVGRLSGTPGAVPPPPPPPTALGAAYSQSGGPASASPPAAGPIAPSRSLDGVTVRPDDRTPADRVRHPGRWAPPGLRARILMPAPDRSSWPASAGAALILLGVAGCGPQGADKA